MAFNPVKRDDYENGQFKQIAASLKKESDHQKVLRAWRKRDGSPARGHTLLKPARQIDHAAEARADLEMQQGARLERILTDTSADCSHRRSGIGGLLLAMLKGVTPGFLRNRGKS